MASTFTTNKVLEKPGNGDYVDTWNVPVNGDMDIIDQAFGGVTSLNATAGSATLTSSQYRSLFLLISGAMSANVTYTIPSGVGGQWVIRNTTTDSSGGPWTITIDSGGGGTSTTIVRNTTLIAVSDGTNVRLVDANIANDFVTSAMLQTGAVTTTKIADNNVTYAKIESNSVATVAEFRAATASNLLNANIPWDAAAYVTLTDASTISLDMSSGFNFQVTLGGNRTLDNPTNAKVGQSGVIVVTQDGTGGRTLNFGSNYKFSNGTAPTLSSTANSVNMMFYYVYTTSFILINNVRGVA